MAILRSVDGKFYEVPDKDLEKFEIPADQIKDKLGDAAQAEPGGPGGPGAGPGGPGAGGGGGSQVVIQILGGANAGGGAGGLGDGAGAPQAGEDGDEVQPYWGWWRNHWRNCWRNHWNNCWRNCY